MQYLVLGIVIGLCIPYAWEATTPLIFPEPIKTNQARLADSSLTEAMNLIKYDYATGQYICDDNTN